MNKIAAHELLNLFVTEVFAPWKAQWESEWNRWTAREMLVDDSSPFIAERKQWKKIGSGWYGVAFAHADHPDVVIKADLQYVIIDSEEAYTGPVEGWCRYAKIASKSRSKHALKIFAMSDCGNIAVIERLTALPGVYSGEFKTLSPDLQRLHRTLQDEWQYHRIIADKGLPKTFRQFLTNLHEATDRSAGWDLHDGNVMLRADGTAVVTDPFT